MKTKKIDSSEVKKIIDDAGGRFFTVCFVKRTDNTLRTLNCRRGVKKGIKGTAHRSHKKGLVTVYSSHDKGYRHINLSGVRYVISGGVKYVVS